MENMRFGKNFLEMKETNLSNLMNNVRVVSINSDGGIFSKSFCDEGFKLEFALESTEARAKTYKANLNDNVVVKDIRSYKDVVDAEVCLVQAPFLEKSMISNVAEIFNKMKSLKVFVIAMVNPVYDAKFKDFEEILSSELKDFEVTINKLNSHDYGIVQERKHVFIIGSKIGTIEIPKLKSMKITTVGDAFKDIVDELPNQLDYIKFSNEIKDIPSGIIKPHRLSWNTSSNRRILNSNHSLVLHPNGKRTVSVREFARLIGMKPDVNGKEFIFEGSLREKQIMVSCSIPMCVSSTIAKEIKKAFGEYMNMNDADSIEFVSK